LSLNLRGGSLAAQHSIEFPGLLEIEQRENHKTLYYFDVDEGLTLQDVTSGENSFLAKALSITYGGHLDNQLSYPRQNNKYSERIEVHDYEKSIYYKQKYKVLWVIGGGLRINLIDEKVAMIASDIVPNLDIDIQPTITEEVALQIAEDAVGAELYMWEVERTDLEISRWRNHTIEVEEEEMKRWSRYAFPVIVPIGRRNLVNIHHPVRYILAYACYIHSRIPYDQRLVYVDAKSGNILWNSSTLLNDCPVDFNQNSNSGLYNTPPCMKKCYDAPIASSPDITQDNSNCHSELILPTCTGNAQVVRVPTLYYGCRDIQVEGCFDTEINDFVHVLRNTTLGFPPIEVRLGENLPLEISEGNAPYVGFKPDDEDNDYYFGFTDVGELSKKHDLTAVSAYWAAANAFNLFKNKYLINSYDNAGSTLRIKVNALNGGAEWGVSSTEYNHLRIGYNYEGGYAYGFRNPSVTLDIMGHEYGHGVMRNHFNITGTAISVETRALHEGLADIFGVLAEDYAANQGLISFSEVDWSFAEDSQQFPNRFADRANEKSFE